VAAETRDGDAVSAAMAHGVGSLRGRSSRQTADRGGAPARCGSEAHEGEVLGLEVRHRRQRAEACGKLRMAGGRAKEECDGEWKRENIFASSNVARR
jgi:hypothetical protein